MNATLITFADAVPGARYVTLDGHDHGVLSQPDGLPALLAMPGFVPGTSHGYPEFIAGCDAVVMGRETFLPVLGAPDWPWPGLRVYVLTSRPLPAETPPGVVVSDGGPAGLLRQLRSRSSDGDIHLVGGPRTIEAFCEEDHMGSHNRQARRDCDDGSPGTALWCHGLPLRHRGLPARVPAGFGRSDGQLENRVTAGRPVEVGRVAPSAS